MKSTSLKMACWFSVLSQDINESIMRIFFIFISATTKSQCAPVCIKKIYLSLFIASFLHRNVAMSPTLFRLIISLKQLFKKSRSLLPSFSPIKRFIHSVITWSSSQQQPFNVLYFVFVDFFYICYIFPRIRIYDKVCVSVVHCCCCFF